MTRLVSLLALLVLLAGCDPGADIPKPKGKLPAIPADIQRCFNESVGNIPDRALTISEVERLWKNDRVRAVVMQRCGKRLIAWYGDLRGKWR